MTWPYWHTFRDVLVCEYMLHVCYGGCSSREEEEEGKEGEEGLSKVHQFSAFTGASMLSWQTFALIHVCDQV